MKRTTASRPPGAAHVAELRSSGTPSTGASAPDLDVEQLQTDLHRQIDSLFESHFETGVHIHWLCLQLAGRLIKAATPWIDSLVANELRQAGTESGAEALAAAERARADVKAMRLKVDGQTPQSTATVGLVGAYHTVSEIGVYTGDPYLSELAEALRKLRLGQVHPWLVVPKIAVHPRHKASEVLELRAKVFCVVEYLVGSGLYATKTDAIGEVADRLGITAEALKKWRTQQRNNRRAQFDLELETMRLWAAEVKRHRQSVKSIPELGVLVHASDQRWGLPALEWISARLAALGANKGR